MWPSRSSLTHNLRNTDRICTLASIKASICLPFLFFGPLNICRKKSSNSPRVPNTNARPYQQALRTGDSGVARPNWPRTGGCQIQEAMTALEGVRWSTCCGYVSLVVSFTCWTLEPDPRLLGLVEADCGSRKVHPTSKSIRYGGTPYHCYMDEFRSEDACPYQKLHRRACALSSSL